jgi:hypothetical protein
VSIDPLSTSGVLARGQIMGRLERMMIRTEVLLGQCKTIPDACKVLTRMESQIGLACRIFGFYQDQKILKVEHSTDVASLDDKSLKEHLEKLRDRMALLAEGEPSE